VGDGYRAKNSELLASEGLPFVRAGNLNGSIDLADADRLSRSSVLKAGEKRSKPGDIVFTSKGTVGRFAPVTDDTPECVYSPQVCYWRVLDRNRIDPYFLFFWMQSAEFLRQIDAVKGQTDMADYVSLRDQRRMTISLPAIEEQRALGGILARLHQLLEQERLLVKAIDRSAHALFGQWYQPVKDEE
jgi:type I restriction enzyme S subunit